MEYAAFQGLPKSRARKKDKNVGTIESEQHFLNFLDMMKQEEEADQKNEPKLEYSYQIKDDKKVTSTPLIEFLSAKNQEKRDVKVRNDLETIISNDDNFFQRKKLEEKKKQRDDEKKTKKIQIAKNVPESIKEVKEDAVYEDGIMIRTVPSRLSRNEKKKDPKVKAETKQKSEDNVERAQERRDKERDRRESRDKDSNAETKTKSEKADKEKARRENKEKRDARRKAFEEKDNKRRMDRYEKSLQKETDQKSIAGGQKKVNPPLEKEQKKDPPVKNETKRYSALRKARQEKTTDAKDPSEASQKQDEAPVDGENQEAAIENITVDAEVPYSKPEDKARAFDSKSDARKEARLKRDEERRAREANERAQRQIKNKDRPTMQIYQPKRRQESDPKPESLKSSDENSETSRKRSDNERRRERRSDKKPSRKNSREENFRKKKTSRSEDDAGDKASNAEEFPKVSVENQETLAEKLENLALSPTLEFSETSKADIACVDLESGKESTDVQE